MIVIGGAQKTSNALLAIRESINQSVIYNKEQKCINCGICANECPGQILRIGKNGPEDKGCLRSLHKKVPFRGIIQRRTG